LLFLTALALCKRKMSEIRAEYEAYHEDLRQDFFDRDPVMRIVRDREENGYDTTYDHFMCDYVGHPVADRNRDGHSLMPEIVRYREGAGHVNFDERLHASYTNEGHLIVVRKAGDMSWRDKNAFFVATADLRSDHVMEWDVVSIDSGQVRLPGQYMKSELQTRIGLRHGKLAAVDSQPDFNMMSNPLDAVVDKWDQERELERQKAKRPHILLGSQACIAALHNGKQEQMAPIMQIDYGLQLFERKYRDRYEELKHKLGGLALQPEEHEARPGEVVRSLTLVSS
jgi:hypothetical protein